MLSQWIPAVPSPNPVPASPTSVYWSDPRSASLHPETLEDRSFTPTWYSTNLANADQILRKVKFTNRSNNKDWNNTINTDGAMAGTVYLWSWAKSANCMKFFLSFFFFFLPHLLHSSLCFAEALGGRGTLEGRWYLWKAIPILPLTPQKAGKSQLLSISMGLFYVHVGAG